MNWKSEILPIEKLIPLKNNPRTITKSEFEKLERDHRHGSFKPIVLNADYTILAGNQRYQYYKKSKIKDVWCSIPDEQLSDEAAKEIVLLDNTHRGELDMSMLANEFEDAIRALQLDFAMPSFTDKNKEINPDDLGNEGKLILKFDYETYLHVLDMFNNKQQKLGCNSNEEVLLKLLDV